MNGSCRHFDICIKDTCYACSKKQQNMQPLDIMACNTANKPSFKNLTETYLPNDL